MFIMFYGEINTLFFVGVYSSPVRIVSLVSMSSSLLPVDINRLDLNGDEVVSLLTLIF